METQPNRLERLLYTQDVGGSNPSLPTNPQVDTVDPTGLRSEPLERTAKRAQQVSFDISAEDFALIKKIATRAVKLLKITFPNYDKQWSMMDLTACHANGCPLRLKDLLDADDFNFAHDIFGLLRHLNRDTGKLENCFLPRFYKSGGAA